MCGGPWSQGVISQKLRQNRHNSSEAQAVAPLWAAATCLSCRSFGESVSPRCTICQWSPGAVDAVVILQKTLDFPFERAPGEVEVWNGRHILQIDTIWASVSFEKAFLEFQTGANERRISQLMPWLEDLQHKVIGQLLSMALRIHPLTGTCSIDSHVQKHPKSINLDKTIVDSLFSIYVICNIQLSRYVLRSFIKLLPGTFQRSLCTA